MVSSINFCVALKSRWRKRSLDNANRTNPVSVVQLIVGISLILFTSNDFANAQTTPDKRSAKNHGQQIANAIADELLQLIQAGRLSVAREQLEKHLTSNPHDHEVVLLRKALANAYRQKGIAAESEAQFEAIMNYIFAHPFKSRPLLKHVPQILLNLSYIQQGVEPKYSQTLGKTIAVMSAATYDNPRNIAYSQGVSMATGLLARGMMRQSKSEDAVKIYTTEIERLESRWRKNVENPDSWLRLIYMLKSAEETIGDANWDAVQKWNFVRVNLFNSGIERMSQSNDFVQEYFLWKLKLAREYEDLDTFQAARIYQDARQKIRSLINEREIKTALVPLKLQIEKQAQYYDRLQARRRLVGAKLPEVGQVDWLNRPADFAIGNGVEETDAVLFLDWDEKKFATRLKRFCKSIKNLADENNVVVLTNGAGRSFTSIEGIAEKDMNAAKAAASRIKIREAIESAGCDWPVGIVEDTQAVSRRFGITVTPVAVTINPDGTCNRIHAGKDDLSTFVSDLQK